MKIISLTLLLLLVPFLIAQAQDPFKVVVKGKGEPILLFPGLGCTGEVWNESASGRDNGFESIKKNAPGALVEDFT